MNKTLKKTIGFVFFLLMAAGCQKQAELNPEHILQESIEYHDPHAHWDKTLLHVHIQEPRLSNPGRYSILKLNNASNSFELTRNREKHISLHRIDSLGNSSVFLDGKEEIDTVLIKKYRLNPERNEGYKMFYQLLYGLPMSLGKFQKGLVSVTESKFNNTDAYRIEMELNESVISSHWIVYFSQINKEIIGIEIIFKDEPEKSERLYFEGQIIVNDIRIPRIRHWLESKNDKYLGSDLIIKNLY